MIIEQANYGVAGFESEDVTMSPELFAGDTPQVVTIGAVVPDAVATAGLPRWTPVYVPYDGAEMVIPTEGVVANTITIGNIPADSPSGTHMPVYQAGCFNINAINWGDLETDAEKFAAIESPTIVVKHTG